MLSVNPATGESSVLFSEKSAATSWINISDNYRFLKDGSLIWWSERDEQGHLYHLKNDQWKQELCEGAALHPLENDCACVVLPWEALFRYVDLLQECEGSCGTRADQLAAVDSSDAAIDARQPADTECTCCRHFDELMEYRIHASFYNSACM